MPSNPPRFAEIHPNRGLRYANVHTASSNTVSMLVKSKMALCTHTKLGRTSQKQSCMLVPLAFLGNADLAVHGASQTLTILFTGDWGAKELAAERDGMCSLGGLCLRATVWPEAGLSAALP